MTDKKWKKYYNKEYFRLKQLERRKNNPLVRKKLVYIATINGQKFAFLQKSQLQFETMSVDDFNASNDIVKCF